MAIPATLIERLRSHRLVPFVGAGVSMAVKAKLTDAPLFPSWQLLLQRAADRLGTENKGKFATLVRSLTDIDPPNYLQAAHYAHQGLGPLWYTFLKEQFDRRRDEAVDSTLDLARAVWALGSKLVMTTNYDRVLRWSCPEADDIAEWSITAPAEQASALRDGVERPIVWHLHGYVDDAANMILTPNGHERLYHNPDLEGSLDAALTTLRSFLSSKSFLFIGFSLADEEFGFQLKAVSDSFSGSTGPHYALVHENNIIALRTLAIPGIEFVTFPDYGEPLTSLTRQLAAHSEPTTLATPPSPSNDDFSTESPQPPVDDRCDTPPPTIPWVGRQEELDLLADPNVTVIGITGIGGQGKSTLAAKYLADRVHPSFWDWRDCKEESNTLHTHIVRIIERITSGHRRASELSSESTQSVIKIMFSLPLQRGAVFVFDNIDQYVDVYEGHTIEPMHSLIEAAMRAPLGCKFIFTARPKLTYDHARFLQLELDGLTATETQELFKARGLNVASKYVDEVHDLTQGHPLWINLIAMQVLTNRIALGDS